MDLLSLSFVSAAALVGTFVLMVLFVMLLVDALGWVKINVSVNIWFEDKPDGSP